MKSVYIDVLITVNVFIDFILILCAKKALCINTSFKKMLLASLLGGVQSLIALFPPLPFFLNIPIDVLCAAGIVLCAFGKCPFKCFIKRISVFLSLSFSFCGIMMFLYNAFKPKGMEVYNDTVYFNISPVLLIILTLVCYYILKLTKILTKGGNGSGVCKVEIKVNEQSYFSLQRLIRVATLLNRFREIMSLLLNKIFLMIMFPMKPKQGLFRLKALAETEL